MAVGVEVTQSGKVKERQWDREWHTEWQGHYLYDIVKAASHFHPRPPHHHVCIATLLPERKCKRYNSYSKLLEKKCVARRNDPFSLSQYAVYFSTVYYYSFTIILHCFSFLWQSFRKFPVHTNILGLGLGIISTLLDYKACMA